ncbi:AAA family ATPase [Roseomonas sp. HJA6]|uniref:AAA family ATPase n=1 Tax=Roseomonas alba TaxID=2846776 RepID=A0ABS7AGS9_9PROT|nr:AAA family ATPase [Neoroseomonas alba]MBW6400535.1 AAA family ATPase [Neoroseomonas alba]
MELVFLYGQAAAGKLTVARALADRTGLPVFHNHLVVDAVLAVFPFGSDEFRTLRERLWLDVIGTAARAGRSLIFTFAPEPTVPTEFPGRVQANVEAVGGRVTYVALTVSPEEQERRIDAPSRAAFGKLRSVAMLRDLRDSFDASMARMPPATLTIDTDAVTPEAAAALIAAAMAR